jgi:kinetochore protein Spc7/SPC105
MSYRHQLQLKFHPGSFYIENDNKESLPDAKPITPIELTYFPEKKANLTERTPPLSPISLLILKSLQIHVSKIEQLKVTPKQLLRFVSEAWNLATNLEEEARMLEFHGVTKLRLSDAEDNPSLRARCTLLGTSASKTPQPSGKSRIDVDFAVSTRIFEKKEESQIGVLDIQTTVLASKVYGFGTDNGTGLSEKEMQSILNKQLKGRETKFGNGVWSKAVQMLSGTVF